MDKFIPAFPFVSMTANECSDMVDERFVTASEQAASALPGFYNKLVRVDQFLDHYSEQVEAGTNTSSKLFQVFQGTSLSRRESRDQFNRQCMIEQIMQDNEFERRVTDLRSRVYKSTEAQTAHENEFGRTSNSWAALNMDSFGPAAGYNLSTKDLI